MELMRILGSHKLRSLKGNILSFLERSQVIRNSSWVLQSLRLHRKTCIREELGNFSDKKKRVRTQWSNLFIGNFFVNSPSRRRRTLPSHWNWRCSRSRRRRRRGDPLHTTGYFYSCSAAVVLTRLSWRRFQSQKSWGLFPPSTRS